MSFHEKHRRSWVKAITYITLAIISDTVIIYMFTGKIGSTLKLVVGINIISTIIYFLHERIWNSVHWGKGYILDTEQPQAQESKRTYGNESEDYE